MAKSKKIEVVNNEIDDEEEFEELSVTERLINIEKRVNITLVISIATVFFSLCSMIYIINGGNEDYSTDSTGGSGSGTMSESDYTYDTSKLDEISATDIKKESDDETIVVVVARQGCSFCAQYMPVLTSVADKYDVTVKYIDFGKIIDFSTNQPTISDSEAYDTLANLKGTGDWESFADEVIQGTPNTMFIKDNKIIYGINGSQSSDVVETAFKEAGLA